MHGACLPGAFPRLQMGAPQEGDRAKKQRPPLRWALDAHLSCIGFSRLEVVVAGVALGVGEVLDGQRALAKL